MSDRKEGKEKVEDYKIIKCLKMEAVSFSETLVCISKSIWRYNPEDQHRYLHPVTA
jgi:hypothetical protein